MIAGQHHGVDKFLAAVPLPVIVGTAVFRCDEFHQPFGKVFFVGGKLGECSGLVQDGEVLVEA